MRIIIEKNLDDDESYGQFQFIEKFKKVKRNEGKI